MAESPGWTTACHNWGRIFWVHTRFKGKWYPHHLFCPQWAKNCPLLDVFFMGFSVESLKKVWDLKTLGYLFSFLKIRRNHQHHIHQASVTSYWAALCLREPKSTQSVNLASGMAWDPFVPSVPPLFHALVTPHVTVTATATSCSLVS